MFAGQEFQAVRTALEHMPSLCQLMSCLSDCWC